MTRVYFQNSLLLGAESLSGIIAGSVDVWANLPPAADYAEKLYLVRENSGLTVSTSGFWQYPKGLWYSDGVSWEQTPFQVSLSDDAQTLVNFNTASWGSFNSIGANVNAGDHIIFENVIFRNLTGSYTATIPSADTTNWEKIRTSNLLVDYLSFDVTQADPSSAEGNVWWNGDEYTLNIDTGIGPVLQVGQEQYVLFYNDTGSQIDNGKVLHPIGGAAPGGVIVPTVELADASSWETCQGTLFVATSDVANGSLGFGTRFGKVRGVDTSTLGAGAQVWLSDTSPGDFVNTQPQFPSYVISMGGTLNADAVDGEVFVSITTQVEDTISNAWDGAIRETFDFRVSSNGTTITGTLTNPNVSSTDLTLIFSTGFYTFDASSATITLTAGTATNPQMNYVYIPESTKVLTVSTSGFPSDEHCKVGSMAIQDAVTTQTDGGAIRNQNINDHIKSDDDNGHILHMAERIRQLNAQWDNGTESSLAGTPTNVYVSNTSGEVWQMHKQSFPAQDMATGDVIKVANDPTTPYRSTTNLNDITSYSDGTSWNNEWSNIVVWGVVNKTGEPSFLMCNLPSNGYNSEENAIADRSNYTDYSIPSLFKGVGFLIGRFTMRPSGGSFTYNSGTGYLDLRGFFPNNIAGTASGSSGVTTFLGLTDTPSAYTGEALSIAQVNAGETSLEFTDAPSFAGGVTLPTIGSTTGLSFGDGDTILWESADDNLLMTIGNFNIYNFTSTYIRSAKNSNGFQLSPDAATSTIPTLIPSRADINTGLGWAGADQLSLVSGGIEVSRAGDGVDPKFIVSPDAVGTTTGLYFGDGDSGFFENLDDQIQVKLAGTSRYIFTVGSFTIVGNAGGAISTGVASATIPSILVRNGDSNTGLGRAGDDQLSLIAGGVEVARFGDGTNPNTEFNGDVLIGTSTVAKTLTVRYTSSTTDLTANGLAGGAAGDGILIYNDDTTQNNYANIDFRSQTADGRIAFQNTAAGSNEGDFVFISDDTGSTTSEKMRITAVGDIKLNRTNAFIGTNTADGSDTKELFLSGGGDKGSTGIDRGAFIALAGNECSGGIGAVNGEIALGIGTGSNGRLTIFNMGTTASSANMNINATTGQVLRSTSSKQIKENITYDVDPSLALNLKPANFREISTQKEFIGFIAEDCRDVNTKLADGLDEPDGMIALDPIAILSAAVATIKDQDQKIKDLTARIKALEGA